MQRPRLYVWGPRGEPLRASIGTKVIVSPEPGKARACIVGQDGPTPLIATYKTQRDAIARARQELARLGGGELDTRPQR